jgi:lysophospholipase L1-like esterase
LKDVFTVRYINKACSGATLIHLTEPQSKSFALSTVPPQIEAINKGVNLVLMTFGGNDVGFGRVVEQCFALGFRDVASCQAEINQANATLPVLEKKLIDALVKIGSLLDVNAKVVLVSYPHIILDRTFALQENDATIDLQVVVRKLATDMDIFMKNAVMKANAELQREYVIFFDKTKELFAGHEPDASVLTSNNDRWIWEFDGVDPPEWYHFNPTGHTQLGEALSAFIRLQDVDPGSFVSGKSIDLAFVVDTTGSMSDDIAAVRVNLNSIVSNLANGSADFRVAVVSYQDFPSRCSGSYASRVDQDFTNNLTLIKSGIDALDADGGCDEPESVFSGIQAALNLDWTDGAAKAMIVIGDARPLITDGKEPISNITATSLISQSIALDPVAVTAADVGALNQGNAMRNITNSTGGSVIRSRDVVTSVQTVINSTSAQPFAWLGVSYVGKVNEPITFDASGSYDTNGGILVLYEWDFNGDGTFDRSTSVPNTTYIYSTTFTGFVLLRVTSPSNLTALGSASIVVNTIGTVLMTNGTCAVDSNGISILRDEVTGELLDCIPNNLPTEDIPGIREETSPPTSSPQCTIGLFGIICFLLKLLRSLFFRN